MIPRCAARSAFGVPTRVGVNRTGYPRHQSPPGCPHARGGEPRRQTSMSETIGYLSPWTLWAKWSRGAQGNQSTGSYHPVLCHLIDVALVTEALWRSVLPWRWRERVAAALGLEMAAGERCVVFWAGLHDPGEVSPGVPLQLHQTNPVAPALVVERPRAAGLSWGQ